jgi:hypothetical protein
MPKGNTPPQKSDLDKLDPKKRLCAELTAQGLRASEVAEKCGVHRKTVWRWLKTCTLLQRYVIALCEAHRNEGKRYATYQARNIINQMMAVVNGKAEYDKDRNMIRSAPATIDRIRAAKVIVKVAGLDEQVLRVEGEIDHSHEHEVKGLSNDQLAERAAGLASRAQSLRDLIGDGGTGRN